MTNTLCQIDGYNTSAGEAMRCPYMGYADDDGDPICCWPYLPGYHETEATFGLISEKDLIDCPMTQGLPNGLLEVMEKWLDANTAEHDRIFRIAHPEYFPDAPP